MWVLPGTLPAVMVIDRSPKDREAMLRALRRYYQVTLFADGERALDALHVRHPDLMIVDSRVMSGDGLPLLERLRGEPEIAAVPVLSTVADEGPVTARSLARRKETQPPVPGLGMVLCKPFTAATLLQAASQLVSLGVEARWTEFAPLQRDALQSTVAMFNGVAETMSQPPTAFEPVPFQRIREGCQPLVQAVSQADFKDILDGVRQHDDYTYAHSLRVATFLTVFAHGLGLRGDDLSTITAGGLMHDIGKVHVPHRILNKPGSLTTEEWHIMRSHVDHTLAALDQAASLPRGARIIAAQHHEKLDGTGYPAGLARQEINELARMAAIADVFGALTDRRCYKAPMAAEKALSIMNTMPHALDGHLLALFREMLLDMVDQIDAPEPLKRGTEGPLIPSHMVPR